jgi:hypothetical protein
MRVTLFTHGGSALISRLVVAPDALADARPTPVAPTAPTAPPKRRRLSSRARAIMAWGS